MTLKGFCDKIFMVEKGKSYLEQLSKKNIDLSAMGKNMSLYGAVGSSYHYCFDEEEKAFYMVMNDASIIVIMAE